MTPPEELFDVVDEHDRVIGQSPRSEVHRRGLLHRAVSIFVRNSRGELLVQLRSATKDEFPSCYTSSASGHVSAGETYDETAPRELEEELGLTVPVVFLAQFPASPETAREHTALYEAVTVEPPVPDPGEIAALEWRTLADLTAEVARVPEAFTPPFRVLLAWYVAHQREPGDDLTATSTP